MKLHMTMQIWRKGSWYIAKCPELDFVSQGRSQEEAKKNLKEVIEIQLEEMSEMNTLKEYLEECGYTFSHDAAIPDMEMIGFEKADVQVQ